MRIRPPATYLAAALTAGLLSAFAPASAAAVPTAGQSRYVAVTPNRVLDTSTDVGGHRGAFGPGEAYDLPLQALPAATTAVVLNVTADRPTVDTAIRVYPTPDANNDVPTVSNLNVPRDGSLADLVVSKVTARADGVKQVRLRNDAGSVRMVADLAGYYVADGSGSGFTGIAPVRVLDTRGGAPLGAQESLSIDVKATAQGGSSGVPVGATAAVLNVTAITPTTSTVVRAYPDGQALPNVSNLNAEAGAVVANLVVVALGPDERVRLHNASGRTHFAVDLAGWFVPGSGDVFHPLDPYRALDTRTTSSPIGPGQDRSLVAAGSSVVPWHATSVALTVTAVSPTTASYLTVHPGGGAVPLASNVNTTRGRTVPNAVMVKVGPGGALGLYNRAGSVHVVVDVAGWFGPPGDGYDLSWPQCTNPYRTGTTSNHPAEAAFAVIGVTNGRPYTRNACLADEFAWANTLPGGGSGYLLLDAPGQGDAALNWGARRSPRACDGTTTPGCGYDYGWWAADYAVAAGLPADQQGGTPQLWMDVEGPYQSPTWQSDTRINAAVVQGAVDRLRSAGIRTGVYSRQSDWTTLTGGLAIADLQQWVFTAASSDAAAARCQKSQAFTTGSVVLSQFQVASDRPVYDRDHAC